MSELVNEDDGYCVSEIDCVGAMWKKLEAVNMCLVCQAKYALVELSSVMHAPAGQLHELRRGLSSFASYSYCACHCPLKIHSGGVTRYFSPSKMEHQFEPLQNDLILRTAWGMLNLVPPPIVRLTKAIADFF